MPKLGMRPIRREALISATIEALAEDGGLDARVSDIARKAGVSTGLAHHYFGSKEELFVEAMRHLLVLLGTASAASQKRSKTPQDRIDAILETNFSPRQFASSTIAAWLVFYVRSLKSEESRRLLSIYTKRLRSNLMYSILPLCDREQAQKIAEGAAALIDGFWLRAALHTSLVEPEEAAILVREYIEQNLASFNNEKA